MPERRRRRWWWRRRGRTPDAGSSHEAPEAALRRKLARDPWRSRSAWNHGDPPGFGPH